MEVCSEPSLDVRVMDGEDYLLLVKGKCRSVGSMRSAFSEKSRGLLSENVMLVYYETVPIAN